MRKIGKVARPQRHDRSRYAVSRAAYRAPDLMRGLPTNWWRRSIHTEPDATSPEVRVRANRIADGRSAWKLHLAFSS